MVKSLECQTDEYKRPKSWIHNFDSLYSILKINVRTREFQFFVLILILGFITRFSWLQRTIYVGLPLAPDAQEYRAIGEGLLKRSYPSPREPLFPLFLAFFFYVLNSSTFTVRLLSLLFSMIVIYLSYSVARVSFEESWEKFLPPLLVATNYYLINHSVMGLREELYTIIIMLLLFLVIKWARKKPSAFEYATIGILSGAICLTRLEGIMIIIALVFFQLWYGSSKARKINNILIAVILISSVFSILGWAITSKLLFNDFFPMSTISGSWLYKHEFGSPIQVTLYDYVFLYHTPLELVKMLFFGIINGLAMISMYLTPLGLNRLPFGLIMLILGLIFSLREEKLFVLHLVLFGGTLPYLILFALMADFRFLYQFMPIVFLLIAYSANYLKRNHSKKVLTFRIFFDKRINLSMHLLITIPIFLIILVNILKFLGNLVMWKLFWMSSYMLIGAIVAVDVLTMTLITLYLYFRWSL